MQFKSKIRGFGSLLLSIFLGLLIIFYFFYNIYYSDINIAESIHNFRQTQTALTAFYLESWKLYLYETPVLGGPSWRIPFEFPIYQAVVKLFNILTGVPLVQSGKIISFLFFSLSLIPVVKIFKFLNFDIFLIKYLVAFILICPIYFYWSGTFMIESAALFFILCFIYFAIKIIFYFPIINLRDLVYASVFLVLTGLQKSTYIVGPLIVFPLLFIFINFGKITNNHKIFLKILIYFILSILLIYFWIYYSDIVKSESYGGKWLTSHGLKGWNYGRLSYLIDLTFYNQIFFERVFFSSSLLVFIFFLSLLNLIFDDKKSRLFSICCLTLFLLPILIFRNLFFVHDYYLTANVIFVQIFIGFNMHNITKNSTIFFNNFKFNNNLLSTILLLSIFIIYANSPLGKYYYKSKKNAGVNNILEMTNDIKENSNKYDTLIYYGFDWSSVIAFYSERKSLGARNFSHEDIDNIYPEPSLILNCLNFQISPATHEQISNFYINQKNFIKIKEYEYNKCKLFKKY